MFTFVRMNFKRFSANLIQLDTVDSTNNYAANLIKTTKVANGTVVMTKRQTNGKGQRGSSWTTEEGKNLIFSLIVFPDIAVSQAHYISIATALALQKTLSNHVKNVKIKWPNDILVDKKKIAGVLVENQLRGEVVLSTIAGVGLNVNQTNFDEILNATSVAKENSKEQNLTELFNELYVQLDFYFDHLLNKNFKLLLARYYENLYGFNETNKFETSDQVFEANLIGIDDSGKLILQRKTGNQHFDIKEIKLILA